MGSGASSLTTAQSLIITKELKTKYEQLKLEGLDDLTIQTQLSEEYNKFVQSFADTNKQPEVKKTALKVSLSKKIISPSEGSSKTPVSKNTSSKVPSRRKSFDAAKKATPIVTTELKSDMTTPSISEQPAAVLSTTASAPTLSPTNNNEVVDSWDSVSTQPFCKICQMAFKSPAFLERHVKYSDIHTRNVNIQKEAGENPLNVNKELNKDMLPIFGSTPSAKLNPKQVEGQHYKCLYTGSKFFWRTQETVDLNFYHHILSHAIEAISYDLVRSKEMPRMYFNYSTILDILAKADVLLPSDEEAKTTAITTFLLQRLQLNSSKEAAAGPSMSYVPLSGDTTEVKSPLLEKMPVVLIPVPVTRRRRTNAEEIDATITSLTNDRAALVAATGQAEKIANLVYSSASSIASKKWWADFNPRRKLWIWAIRRVIRQKLVAETTANLAERAARKEAASRGAKRQSYISGSMKSKEV